MLGRKLRRIRKICIVKAGGIGDLVVTLPVFESVKDTYPEAELVLCCREYHKELLEGRPNPVDRFIIVPPYYGVRDDAPEDPQVLEKFFKDMQAEEFDIVIQMHGGGGHSNRFVNQFGARRLTLGQRTPDAEELCMWVPFRYRKNEYMRQFEVVSKIGVKPVEIYPSLKVAQKDIDEVRERLPDLKSPYIVLHTGAGSPTRWWPADQFARLGDTFANEGYSIVLTGTWVERKNVEKVAELMHATPHMALNLLSMSGLVGVLAGANLVVSNDSGPAHMAAAIGVPTLVIINCVNLISWAHIKSEDYIAVPSWIIKCPTCGADKTGETSDCKHEDSLLTGASFDDVLAGSRKLLAGW